MLRLLFVWLWMCSLLTSTIGVSVAHIYCYCKGEGTLALSLPLSVADEDAEDCSALGHEAATCCSKWPAADACADSEASCCTRVEAPNCCAASDEGWQSAPHPCTSKTVKIYQLKIDLHGPLSGDQLPDLLPLWADEVPIFCKCFCPALCWRQPLNKAPPEALPTLSGRQICIRHEVFRC